MNNRAAANDSSYWKDSPLPGFYLDRGRSRLITKHYDTRLMDRILKPAVVGASHLGMVAATGA